MPNGMLWAIVQRLPQAEDPLLRMVENSKSGIPAKRKDELLKVILDACQEGSEAYARALEKKKADLGLNSTSQLSLPSAAPQSGSMDVDDPATGATRLSSISLARPSTSIWASGPTSGPTAGRDSSVSSLLGNTLDESSLRAGQRQDSPKLLHRVSLQCAESDSLLSRLLAVAECT